MLLESKIFRISLAELNALAAISLDYLTTQIGLARGFLETHAAYSPLNATTIFSCCILFLGLLLPRPRGWTWSLLLFSCLSWLGALNNILVLTGIFPGLWL